jgi:hypothetical protein
MKKSIRHNTKWVISFVPCSLAHYFNITSLFHSCSIHLIAHAAQGSLSSEPVSASQPPSHSSTLYDIIDCVLLSRPQWCSSILHYPHSDLFLFHLESHDGASSGPYWRRQKTNSKVISVTEKGRNEIPIQNWWWWKVKGEHKKYHAGGKEKSLIGEQGWKLRKGVFSCYLANSYRFMA